MPIPSDHTATGHPSIDDRLSIPRTTNLAARRLLASPDFLSNTILLKGTR